MRNSAFLSSVATVLLAVTPVAAQNDFDALLSDLTFSDAPASSEAITLDVAAEKAIEALKPAPAEPTPSLSMPASVNTVPVSTPVHVQPGPQVYAAPAEAGHVDFNSAFAAQECDTCAGGGCDAAMCSTGSCRGGCGLGSSCGTCVPYRKPALPNSSFYGSFRSDACNVNAWDGYRNRCCNASKHTRGECDCFSDNHGCGSCETQVYDVQPCEPRVCSVPSITRTKRFFDFSKKSDCDEEVCDAVVTACDSAGTCD